MNETNKTAIINALGTAAYVLLVGSFLSFGSKFFANTPDTFFTPVAMLLLLVLSAAVTGYLVFGKPVSWYLDGKKKEALSLLYRTFIALFLLTFIAFLILFSSLK